VNRSVGSLASKAPRKAGSVRETGRTPKWERSHHDSIITVEDTSIACLRAPTLRGVARMCVISGPSASSVASRIRSPVRGKVGAVAAAWNRVTRGVRESSSRGYVPLLLTVGGQPLDSLGFPAGVRASEAGVFGNAAHRSHSSRPPRRAVPAFREEPRIHAMRANSGARRQVVRQQGRPVAKAREARDTREATSCRDLGGRPRKG
jgi:hypothetical protein